MRRYTSEGIFAALMDELGFDNVFRIRGLVWDYYGSAVFGSVPAWTSGWQLAVAQLLHEPNLDSS
jgi:hypothetical protein